VSEEEELAMDKVVRMALDARLHADMSRRHFLYGVGGLTALTVLGSASAASAQSPGASTGALGGQLNFIGYDGEDARNVAKPFFEANGITVNPTFIADAFEPLTRFETGSRGQLDIISDNKDFMRAVLDAGVELFSPLDMSRIPNAAGLFPAFKNASWLVRDGVVYGIPVIWGDEPCVWDPARWDGPPAKYTDFADSTWAGELVMVDDPVANTWLFAQSLGMAEPNRLTQAQLDEVVAAMLTVKPNLVTFAATLGDQADILVRGDASMAIGGWAYQILIAADKGVTLVSGSPADDGTYYWSDAYAIAVDAPNPDNAYAFIDYMTSAESNAAIASELGSGATVEAAVPLMDESVRDLYPYSEVMREDGGILGSQVVSPPKEDDGDIVGIAKWAEAWQQFKLS
jgi:spermidine/putrescine transport system substrate-binding protein